MSMRETTRRSYLFSLSLYTNSSNRTVDLLREKKRMIDAEDTPMETIYSKAIQYSPFFFHAASSVSLYMCMREEKEFLSMDWDCLAFYLPMLLLLLLSSSSTSFTPFVYMGLFFFLDYPIDWPTLLMYSYVRLWLIVNRKKEKREREREREETILVRCTNIVYGKYIDSVGMAFLFFSFCGLVYIRKEKKTNLFSLRFVLFCDINYHLR